MANGNCTLTIQSVLNFCSTHADLLPLSNVGGYVNEPGLSLANDAMSDLISDPNDWKFNRVEMPILFTCPGKLDLLFAGACVFTLGYTGTSSAAGWSSQGWGIAITSGISVSGGIVTITTLETHRIPVGATIYMTGVVMTTGTTANYNSVFTDNGTNSTWTVGWTVTAITATTISFAAVSGQNNSDAGGAPGIKNFGYLTSASFVELNNTSSPPNVNPCNTYRELPFISRIANPDKIAVMQDMGNGILKIRFNAVPGGVVWGAKMVYQAKAPLKIALTDTWEPFPDNFSAVYRQAMLYRMYRYLNDPKADTEWKKLQQEIAKVQGTDDAEQTDVTMQPESLMGESGVWDW